MTLNYSDTYPGYCSAVLNGRRFLYTRSAPALWTGYYCDDEDVGFYASSRDELLLDAMEVVTC